MTIRKKHMIGLSLALLCGMAVRAAACDLPVFLYALYNWAPDPYAMHVVSSSNTLSAALTRAVEHVRDAGAAALYLEHHTDDAYASQVWARIGRQALPWLVLNYPPATGIQSNAWEGPLTVANVERLLLSPARAELARRLASNECAVWILLESGDTARDAQMLAELTAALTNAEARVILPHEAEELPADDVVPYDKNLRVRFSILRIRRDDPSEELFVSLLCNPDPRLAQARGPLTIPIFGKGRALTVFTELPLSADTLLSVCQFLAGPCACEIKESNPGVDMLMPLAWNTLLRAGAESVLQPMPLAGWTALDTNAPVPTAANTMADTTPENTDMAAVHTAMVFVALVVVAALGATGMMMWRARKELS